MMIISNTGENIESMPSDFAIHDLTRSLRSQARQLDDGPSTAAAQADADSFRGAHPRFLSTLRITKRACDHPLFRKPAHAARPV
jgi:hypothetical protein